MNCSTVSFANCNCKTLFPIEVDFSELFEQIRNLNYNQSELRNSQPVPGLWINSAGNEVGDDVLPTLQMPEKLMRNIFLI